MKLVSYRVQTPVGAFIRAGALHDGAIIDLNMAAARMLADQNEAQPSRLADAMVPAAMLELLEGGPSAMAMARRVARSQAMAFCSCPPNRSRNPWRK